MLKTIPSAQVNQPLPAHLQTNSVSTERLKRQIQPNRWFICTAIALSKSGFGARKPEIPALARAMQNSR